MNQKKIGKFIALLRKDKKLTQENLAFKLGVNSKSISRWENGRCMPDLSLLIPLSKELGVSVNDLMNGEVVDKKEYQHTFENNIIESLSKINKKNYEIFGYVILVSTIIALLFAFLIKTSALNLIAIGIIGFMPALILFLLSKGNKKINKLLIIIGSILVLLSLIFGTIDYIRVKNRKVPIFAVIQTVSFDGGSKEYYGIGYKVIKCNTILGDKSFHFGFYNMEIDYVCNHGFYSEVDNIFIEVEESSNKNIKTIYSEDNEYYVFTYGIDKIKITIENKKYSLQSALKENKITINDIVSRLTIKSQLLDDGTTIYSDNEKRISDGNLTLIKCNKFVEDGEVNTDVYISTGMDYIDGFCR